MRKAVKVANKADNIWTMFVMMPAVILLMNAGIAMYQGEATAADFSQAATGVADKFTGHYVPYIETTSSAILSGIEKLSATASGCLSRSGGPVYVNPALSSQNSCALSSNFGGSKIKPYRTYR